MAVSEPCPDCGGERTAEICPRCLIRVGLDGPGLCLSRSSGPGVALPLGEEAGRGGVLETLAYSIGPVPRILLRDTATSSEPGPIIQMNSPEMPDVSDRGSRLQLLGEIARGGMGAVLKGRDNDLGRDLAVKVLLERHGSDPDLLRRFVEEAQIAGQLQHPGIVPVYELGAFADRRPYFAMKLVKGQTLAEVMAERQDASGDHPRLLAIFLDIAQTMAYAHARGVIHRDLKPSNVMVGSFGEVQVMDWGLAKVLARGGVVDDHEAGKLPPHETVITTGRSDSDSGVNRSQAGSVLGTPSYMAPEQARGENEDLDERVDVFALGSILCEILTGQPAFTGRTSAEILRRAARGDLAEADQRLAGCGAEAELVTLARKALAPEPSDRPTHAGVIADRITAHFSGVQERLRASELAQAASLARAEAERRSRRLTMALAASVLVIAAVGGVGASAYLRQRQARASSAARLLGEAETLLSRAMGQPDDPARWREAAAAASRVDPAQIAEDDARERLARIQSDATDGLRDAERDVVLLRELVRIRASETDTEAQKTDREYARAFADAGMDVKSLGVAESAARLRRRPPAIAVELAAYIDDWSATRAIILKFINADKIAFPREPDRRLLLEVARATDPDPFRDQIRTLLLQPPGDSRAESLRLLADDPRVGELPAATAVLLASAIPEASARVALLRKAVARHPSDIWVNYKLAAALEGLKPPPLDEVVRYYTAARALRPETSHELAHALENSGQADEAGAIFRELSQRLPGDIRTQACLGKNLQDRHLPAEAAPVIDAVIASARKTLGQTPDDYFVHYHLARALASRAEFDQAIVEYREVSRLNPAESAAHYYLGVILCDVKHLYPEAEAEFREAIRLSPGSFNAHSSLGLALAHQGRTDEAIAEFRELIRLAPEEASNHATLGQCLAIQGKLAEAEAEQREAIRLDPKNAYARSALGITLANQDKLAEADVLLREATRLDPNSPNCHFCLGEFLADQGKAVEAIAEFRESIRVDGHVGLAHWSLGDLLRDREQFDEAAATFRRARELGRVSAADVAKADSRIAGVERARKLVGRIDVMATGNDRPADADELRLIAGICKARGRYLDAVRIFTRVFADDPKLAGELRIDAARFAARAWTGKGKDAPPPDETARAGLRAQAQDWLKADLAFHTSAIRTGSPDRVQETRNALNLWKSDSDFIGVRQAEALAKLPKAEQTEWQALWAEVDMLLAKCASGPRPKP